MARVDMTTIIATILLLLLDLPQHHTISSADPKKPDDEVLISNQEQGIFQGQQPLTFGTDSGKTRNNNVLSHQFVRRMPTFSRNSFRRYKRDRRRRMRDETEHMVPWSGSVPNVLPTLLPPLTTPPGKRKPEGLAPAKQITEVPRKPSILEPSNIDDANLDNIVPDENEIAPEPWPEPGPDWTTAYMYLGIAWFIHIYGLAVLMFLIAVVATFTLIDIFVTRTITQRGLSTSLNCLLFLFGTSRAVSLIVNPYGSLERISLLASRLAWSVGFPCLTSMLTTLLLVLVDTTKVSLGPPRFQQFHVVIKLSATHFIVVLGSDIILSFYLRLKALLLVCQLIYVIWSILLTVGFYRVGYLIARNFNASRHSHSVQDQAAKRLEKLIFTCGTLALCNCITHLYGAAGVFGVYSDLTFVPAWPWLIFQTLMRLEEIGMCFVVLILSGKSKHESEDAKGGRRGLACRCWHRVKSYGTCITMRKRESRAELTNDEAEGDGAFMGESLSTYGTTAPESSSQSDPRRRSSESVNSLSGSAGAKECLAVPRPKGKGSMSQRKELKTERRKMSSVDGEGKPGTSGMSNVKRTSLDAVAEETSSTPAIPRMKPNTQASSRPKEKHNSQTGKGKTPLMPPERNTIYPSLGGFNIPESGGHDEEGDFVQKTSDPKTLQGNTGVQTSDQSSRKKRQAPAPPTTSERRTIHPTTEDQNLSMLTKPSVRRVRHKSRKQPQTTVSSISSLNTQHLDTREQMLYIEEER